MENSNCIQQQRDMDVDKCIKDLKSDRSHLEDEIGRLLKQVEQLTLAVSSERRTRAEAEQSVADVQHQATQLRRQLEEARRSLRQYEDKFRELKGF